MARQSRYGSYYTGSFEYKDIKWDCEIRFGGPLHHQGGYDKCLKINSGHFGSRRIDSHDFFGDDKFSIDNFFENGNILSVNLTHGIHSKESWRNPIKQITVTIQK